MIWADYSPGEPSSVLWDAIVIGTGMGGGTIGHQLAKSGMNVLFLEMGEPPKPQAANPPSFIKKVRKQFDTDVEKNELKNTGRLSEKITVIRDGKTEKRYLPLGIGPGGSTAIYGAALERMKRSDFQCTVGKLDNAKTNHPPEWPLKYDAFSQYYSRAEQMYRVRGTVDPLDPDDVNNLPAPPPACERDEAFIKLWRDKGSNPYKMHVGIEYIDNCAECLGRICEKGCKSDSLTDAVKPAVRKFGAKLIMNCRVLELKADKTRVNSVVAICDGQTLELKGKIVIVSAGAINSPAILLRSVSEFWPNGLGNNYDQVGRNLMFHASDFFAVWPRKTSSTHGPKKSIALNDLYIHHGRKLGCFQSVGVNIEPGHIYQYLTTKFQKWRWPLKGLTLQGFRIPAYLGSKFFKNAGLFASIVEDFPYASNRVILDSDSKSGVAVDYRTSGELKDRINLSRTAIAQLVSPCRSLRLSGADNLNFGHSCGTCRMGKSPQDSVIDTEGKIHGMENVYIVDGSFFPTSAGVNPSLTIAANAIRVADLIVEKGLNGEPSHLKAGDL